MADNGSFCSEVKAALTARVPKRGCCRRTYRDTMEAFNSGSGVSKVIDGFRCNSCRAEFLRAAFVFCGSVTDPAKEYHLDFSFTDPAEAELVTSVLTAAGFAPGSTARRGRSILYYKNSETIGDILAYIGAVSAAFDIMNSRIVKDVRNNVNRLVNCDTANIGKALSASHKYIDAIEFLESSGAMAALPEELREAAELRRTYTQASLGELAGRCCPPITKSGMKHRLERLLAAADEVRNSSDVESDDMSASSK